LSFKLIPYTHILKTYISEKEGSAPRHSEKQEIHGESILNCFEPTSHILQARDKVGKHIIPNLLHKGKNIEIQKGSGRKIIPSSQDVLHK
jgi:hypothetical protein